jgi:hypothetical protein
LVLNLNSQNNISYSGGGTSWFDLTGNNNTGVLTNGPTFDSTTRSVVFDGVDDYVVSSSNIGISGATPRTLECWYYADSTLNKSILGYGGNNQGVLFDTMTWNNGQNIIGHYYGGNYDTISTLPPRVTINQNKWNHIIHMYDGTNVSIYTNGVFSNSKEFSISAGNQLNTNNSTFKIGTGQFMGAYEYAKGKISGARIYNKVLSQSEILQNYYQGNIVTNGLILNLDAGNLVSYGGTGTLLRDLSNTTTGATLMNGPTYTTLNGGGIVLDGADDYILVNRTASLEPTAITMQCVFYMGTFTNYPGIIAKGYWDSQTTPKDIEGYGMHIRPNYNLWVDFNNNGTRQILQGDGQDGQGVNAGITQNSLNFITVTIGPTGAKIYNKGINYYSDNVNYTIAYTGNNGGTVPADLWIGWMQYKGGTLDGKIYTASIYNRALTQSEVIQNFNAHKSRYGL